MAKMIYRFRWWRAEHVGHEVCHLAVEWFIVPGWEIAAKWLLLALCFEHDLSSNFSQSQATARKKLSSKWSLNVQRLDGLIIFISKLLRKPKCENNYTFAVSHHSQCVLSLNMLIKFRNAQTCLAAFVLLKLAKKFALKWINLGRHKYHFWFNEATWLSNRLRWVLRSIKMLPNPSIEAAVLINFFTQKNLFNQLIIKKLIDCVANVSVYEPFQKTTHKIYDQKHDR